MPTEVIAKNHSATSIADAIKENPEFIQEKFTPKFTVLANRCHPKLEKTVNRILNKLMHARPSSSRGSPVSPRGSRTALPRNQALTPDAFANNVQSHVGMLKINTLNLGSQVLAKWFEFLGNQVKMMRTDKPVTIQIYDMLPRFDLQFNKRSRLTVRFEKDKFAASFDVLRAWIKDLDIIDPKEKQKCILKSDYGRFLPINRGLYKRIERSDQVALLLNPEELHEEFGFAVYKCVHREREPRILLGVGNGIYYLDYEYRGTIPVDRDELYRDALLAFFQSPNKEIVIT